MNKIEKKDINDVLQLSESTGHLVKIAHRLYQRLLSKELFSQGVKLSHWHFLRYLWEEDGITQRKLSQCVLIQETTAVAVLREMEKDGLIERKKSEKDGRKVLVFLTQKAKKLMLKFIPKADEVNYCGISDFSDKEIQQYKNLTRRIIKNLEGKVGESGKIGLMSIGVIPSK